jgi:alkylresorcinol/alkylpyrone synthase
VRIAAVGEAAPEHFYDQETILAALKRHWARRHYNLERLERLHRNVLVGGRHLALPIEELERLTRWGESNDAWIRAAREVGERAVRRAVDRGGLSLDDVGTLIFVSVTGIATPSIDALLMNRLALPASVKRLPIFGLGCVGGAAGVARAADYVRAFPSQAAVVLSVELCSLTLQREDLSVPNLIASGLFGDGAAAAIVVGAERAEAGPEILDTRSVFYPDSEEVMGWEISERGFRVVLSSELPDLVRRRLRPDVEDFLAVHGLGVHDVGAWIAHPGGPKVLEAVQDALELPREALEVTWRHLLEVGNLSSASVLMVLGRFLDEERPEPGTHGVLFAMGPGFCLELVLLRW